MLIRCASILALAAASSFAMTAAARSMPQSRAYPPSTSAPASAAPRQSPPETTDSSNPNAMQPQPDQSSTPNPATSGDTSTDPMANPEAGVSSPRRTTVGARSTSAMDAAIQRVADVCDTELRTYCSGVPSGNGRVLTCLKGHRADASSQCQTALDQVPMRYSSTKSTRHRMYRHAAVKHHRGAQRKAPS